jgi:hypothetical protein
MNYPQPSASAPSGKNDCYHCGAPLRDSIVTEGEKTFCCQIEQRQLETMERLKRLLMVDLVVTQPVMTLCLASLWLAKVLAI